MCHDRGSVTVWAAALAGLIWLASSAALLYGSAVAGRHRAETAADLAALAAAVHVPEGAASACAAGARIAVRNGGSLWDCRLAGADVEVVVSSRVSLGGLGALTVIARARAGPVLEVGGHHPDMGEGSARSAPTPSPERLRRPGKSSQSSSAPDGA